MSDSLELKIQEIFEVIEEQGKIDPMGVTLEICIWDSSQKPYAYYARLSVPVYNQVRGGPTNRVVAGDQSHSYSIEGCIDVVLAILKNEKPE